MEVGTPFVLATSAYVFPRMRVVLGGGRKSRTTAPRNTPAVGSQLDAGFALCEAVVTGVKFDAICFIIGQGSLA